MGATLLAIETATSVCGIALAQEGRVTVELELRRPRAHAENLVPLLRDALRYGGIRPEGLDAVAVSEGPGSFTGLRIGVSTAKGLACAAGAALVGVPTLEALAAAAAAQAQAGDVLCGVLDARRDEVYAAAYRVTPERGLAPLAEAAALQVAALPAWLGEPEGGGVLWLCGNGARKAAPAFQDTSGLPVRPLGAEACCTPSAAWIARLGLRRLAAGTVEDVAAFEPCYLKAFAATKRPRSPFEQLSF